MMKAKNLTRNSEHTKYVSGTSEELNPPASMIASSLELHMKFINGKNRHGLYSNSRCRSNAWELRILEESLIPYLLSFQYMSLLSVLPTQ